MSGITKDKEFWLEDGNIVLLIDGVYFKLYRELLMKQYGLFRDVLSLPVGSSPQEGRSVELPIRIPDISARDFQLLLTHMFGLATPDLQGLSTDDQLRLLRVAHRLQPFGVAHRLATYLMQKLDPLARLSLCVELCLDDLQQESTGSHVSPSAAEKQERKGSAADEGAASPKKTDRASGWLADAFVAVVLDFDMKLPFYDRDWPLDATWRLHLATAREKVSEGRRTAIDKWATGDEHGFSFRSMDIMQVTHLPHMTQSKSVQQRFWKETLARNVKIGWFEYDTGSETFMPSAEAERKLVRRYLNKMYDTIAVDI